MASRKKQPAVGYHKNERVQLRLSDTAHNQLRWLAQALVRSRREVVELAVDELTKKTLNST